MSRTPRDSTLQIRLPSSLKRQLQRLAEKRDETVSTIVLRALKAELEKEK